MSDFKEMFRRLGRARGWTAAQFWATLLIVLAGIAWTRLPDKHGWQVGLTLLIPPVLLAAVLVLQAGTMRGLLGEGREGDRKQAGFVLGALSLLVWIAVFWAAWLILDWCGDQVELWAGYLNSQAPAALRARLLTYDHIQSWLTGLVWIFRWIVVPGKVIPYAVASAQWGWRLPWRKLIRMLLNWRWWAAVVPAALVGVALTGHFFSGAPQGTVSRQIWSVALKLGGAYLLAVASWVVLLVGAVVVLARTPQPVEDALEQRLLEGFQMGRKWIWASACWMAASILWDLVSDSLPEKLRTSGWVDGPITVVLAVAVFVLQVGLIRSMAEQTERNVRLVWGALSTLVWMAIAVAGWVLLSYWHQEIVVWVLDWIVLPAALLPFAVASAKWGLKMPWRKVVLVVINWRWWFGVVAAVIVGEGLPAVFHALLLGRAGLDKPWIVTLRNDAIDLIPFGAWIVLLGWLMTLFMREEVRLPLPESGDDVVGNA